MIEYAKCRSCGEEFARDESERWKRVCISCFIEGKRAEKRAYEERILREQEAQRREQATLPPDIIRLLLQLCHPDKHGGSDAATRATRWLLEQRKP